MIAGGIDVGGTKIALHCYGDNFAPLGSTEVPTPKTYPALLDAIAQLSEGVGPDVPLGVSAAGQLHPRTGCALTANFCGTGRPLLADVEKRLGRKVTWLNDAQAFVLSEAVLGVGQDAKIVSGLILGTGCSAAIAIDQKLLPRHSGLGGEIGHLPLSATLALAHDLPCLECGCGQRGCIETLVSGPGLTALCAQLTGTAASPAEIATTRHSDSRVMCAWNIWCLLVVDVLRMVQASHDPEMIVLGGGLSLIDGVIADLEAAFAEVQIRGFDRPQLQLAQGGAQSGARGAALAALRDVREHA